MPTSDSLAVAVRPIVDALMKQFTTPAKPAQSWYAIRNQTETPDEAEVMIDQAIGAWGIDAAQFIRDFKAITAPTIRIRINSPGGEVFGADAIYNAIKEHPSRTISHVDSLAASAGSVIAVAANEVRMADNAYMMIHEAQGGVMGDAADMQRYAGLLGKLNDTIAAAYQKKTGKPKNHWRALMKDETWFTAKEAKAEGLADVVYSAEKPASASASFDFKIYNKVPAEVLAMFQTKTAPEALPRGDALPAVPTKEPTMATDQTPAPAQVPADAILHNEVERLNAQSIQGYIDRGRDLGRAEGRKAEQDRMRSLLAACPGKPGIAVNAFLAGHNESMVAMLVDAEMRAEMEARQRTSTLEVEIARLNAQIATGGHPGVAMSISAPSASGPITAVPEGMDPEAQAKLEWDSDPMIRARNQETTWKLYRVNELKGNVRVLKH